MNEYKAVEKELRKYKGLKVFVQNAREEIENIENDIGGAKAITYDSVGSKTNNINRSVELEVINRDSRVLELQEKIAKAEEIIHRIDRAFQKVLNDTEAKILELFYMDNLPWFKISWEAKVSESTCRRIRKKAIKRLIIPFYGDNERKLNGS